MALIKCTDCQAEVSDAAPACLKCGRPIALIPPLPKSAPPPISSTSKIIKPKEKTKTSTVFVIVVLLIIVSVLNYVLRDDDDTSASVSAPFTAPVAPVAHVLKDYVTTAQGLSDAYAKNEVAADNEMIGRKIYVGGDIQSVDKNFANEVVLNFATNNEFMPARMTLTDDQKPTAATLSKGDTVLVTCAKMARIIGSPSGSDCKITHVEKGGGGS